MFTLLLSKSIKITNNGHFPAQISIGASFLKMRNCIRLFCSLSSLGRKDAPPMFVQVFWLEVQIASVSFQGKSTARAFVGAF